MLICSTPSRSRKGVVLPLVAVSLILLLGFAAIALDGGLLQDNKRKVQAAADAAALAAANVLFQNYPSLSQGNPDPGGKAAAAALTSAAANKFPNNKTTSTVTVNIPPKTGPFTNKIGYAEVIVTHFQDRYFSTIWGKNKISVAGRAVAVGFWGGTGKGVIVLDPTTQYALDASGKGSVTVTGGASMVVNSSNSGAARATGGGTLTATRFEVTGGTVGTFNGPVDTGVPPSPDPLAYLPAPSVPPNGTMTKVGLGQGNHQYTLTPGRYTNLPTFNPGDVVVLRQASANSAGGIFYIDGGGFNSTGANIIMDPTTSGGVMIYNRPSSSSQSQSIQIQGNSSGTVNLSALTSGPYAGILLWQNRTSSVSLSVSGNGNFSMKGTFYTANANLQVTGNGNATIGSQYVSRTLSLSGGGAITIDYNDNGTARKRFIGLVE